MITKDKFISDVREITFSNGMSSATPMSFESDTPIMDSNRLSWSITRFPNMDELAPLSKVRGMSTAANAYIINTICRHMSLNQTYLNVGVFKGYSMFAGMIGTECNVVGVDNFSEFKDPSTVFYENLASFDRRNVEFHQMDYVEFMNDYNPEIDFYFYDGRHNYQDQYGAILNVRYRIAKGGIIMIDDTNYPGVKDATFDALRDLSIDYDVWLDLPTANNMHPTYWNGILILEVR